MSDSCEGSKKWRSKGNDYCLYDGLDPIDWGLLKKGSDLNEANLLRGDFSYFKRLNHAATYLIGAWVKMGMRHMFSVFNRDTITGLEQLLKDDPRFATAKPLITCIKHFEAIFMGKFVFPKYSPENVKIYDDKHPIFEEQIKHLKYFTDGFNNSQKPDRWFDKGTVSRMVQCVKTAHAIAKDFFEENKKLGYKDLYFSFFLLSNRRLESQNGIVRTLNYDSGSIYDIGKSIARFMDWIKYKNRAKNKYYGDGKNKRFQNTVNYLCNRYKGNV